MAARGKLEPLRAKMAKLADWGWLHKRRGGSGPCPPGRSPPSY
ncbi:hypothetical protein [Streptomyces sp. NBC_00258]|nr:hypothetical protein [Streptomyces sp. NBC_00258]